MQNLVLAQQSTNARLERFEIRALREEAQEVEPIANNYNDYWLSRLMWRFGAVVD